MGSGMTNMIEIQHDFLPKNRRFLSERTSSHLLRISVAENAHGKDITKL